MSGQGNISALKGRFIGSPIDKCSVMAPISQNGIEREKTNK